MAQMLGKRLPAYNWGVIYPRISQRGRGGRTQNNNLS